MAEVPFLDKLLGWKNESIKAFLRSNLLQNAILRSSYISYCSFYTRHNRSKNFLEFSSRMISMSTCETQSELGVYLLATQILDEIYHSVSSVSLEL